MQPQSRACRRHRRRPKSIAKSTGLSDIDADQSPKMLPLPPPKRSALLLKPLLLSALLGSSQSKASKAGHSGGTYGGARRPVRIQKVPADEICLLRRRTGLSPPLQAVAGARPRQPRPVPPFLQTDHPLLGGLDKHRHRRLLPANRLRGPTLPACRGLPPRDQLGGTSPAPPRFWPAGRSCCSRPHRPKSATHESSGRAREALGDCRCR
jgi:hypothetical protein